MARGNYPSAKQDQYVLRLPDGLRAQIKSLAKQGGRSMNAEIVVRLEESFNARKDLDQRSRGSSTRAATIGDTLPAWVADMLNRRVTVEQVLFDVAAGKRPPLTPDECRELALKLGIPSDTAAPRADPVQPAEVGTTPCSPTRSTAD